MILTNSRARGSQVCDCGAFAWTAKHMTTAHRRFGTLPLTTLGRTIIDRLPSGQLRQGMVYSGLVLQTLCHGYHGRPSITLREVPKSGESMDGRRACLPCARKLSDEQGCYRRTIRERANQSRVAERWAEKPVFCVIVMVLHTGTDHVYLWARQMARQMTMSVCTYPCG